MMVDDHDIDHDLDHDLEDVVADDVNDDALDNNWNMNDSRMMIARYALWFVKGICVGANAHHFRSFPLDQNDYCSHPQIIQDTLHHINSLNVYKMV